MELEHSFTIPVPVDQAWQVLLDVERIAPCMPGATLESVEGDSFDGRVKVKVGPITVTYKGSAQIVERDETAHRAVIEASGKEARGSGTARATVTTSLVANGDTTEAKVHTALAVTGKPAQFGRGVMVEVAQKLLDRFADCLAEELAAEAPAAEVPAAEAPAETAAAEPETGEAAPAPAAVAPAPATPAAAAIPRPRPSAEAIDLLDVAGGSVAKRVGPVVAGLLVVLVIVWLIRRRR
jgi:uncharacterized protein